jgi:hypothetical protein
MRAVKDSNLPKQDNSHTAALSFGDFSPQFHEQCFYVAPLDVPTRGAAKDQFEAPLVLPLHATMVLRTSTDTRE